MSTDILSQAARLRDRGGDWARRISRHRSMGRSALVYLNRFEGISPDCAQTLATHDPDHLEAMSDSQFRKLSPQAQDSWILLNPDSAYILDIYSATSPLLEKT